MKVDILAIGAHPDDIELSAAGTVIHHVEAGRKVAVVDLTAGELGTRGTPEIRAKEAQDAAEKMGVMSRECVGLKDGFFQYTEENIRALIPYIRKYRPRIVLANTLEDRHPDHGRAARLISDACFYSGLLKIVTEDEEGNRQQRWRPDAVYHYLQDRILVPDLVVDITPHIDQKMEAIRCYKSQFYNPDSEEPESPISGKDFLENIIGRARSIGRQIGVEFGEGFLTERPLGVSSFEDLL